MEGFSSTRGRAQSRFSRYKHQATPTSRAPGRRRSTRFAPGSASSFSRNFGTAGTAGGGGAEERRTGGRTDATGAGDTEAAVGGGYDARGGGTDARCPLIEAGAGSSGGRTACRPAELTRRASGSWLGRS